jgi:hypothetical protein|tara:strand:- start:4774 stop:5016 length:243 start_codon:yes stop_codon:yes gene_type:complete
MNNGLDNVNPNVVKKILRIRASNKECSAALSASLFLPAPKSLAINEVTPIPIPEAKAMIRKITGKVIEIAARAKADNLPT